MTATRHSAPSVHRRRGGWATAFAAVALTASVVAAPPAQADIAGLDVNLGGWTENSAQLPDGDLLISNIGKGQVQRIDADTRAVSTVAKVDAPGGLAVTGNTVYVVTGNSPLAAVTRKGGVQAIDLTTSATRTVTSGFGEPNGLGLLPGGDLVFTVTLGPGSGVQRLNPATGQVRRLTNAVPFANGLAVGPDGQIYAGSTAVGTIFKVDPSTGATSVAAGISVLLDDFGFLPDGRIVAATVAGAVDVIDLRTGSNRPVSLGNIGATSAKPAGNQVVVTSVTGRVFTLPTP